MSQSDPRFPAPWTFAATEGGYALLDARGHTLAYIYTRDGKTAASVAKVLTSEEGKIFVERLAMLPVWVPPIVD